MKIVYVLFVLLQFVISVLSDDEISEDSPRIVGGHQANLDHVHYHVAVYKRLPSPNTGVLQMICSGALVTPKSVVTTANCLHSDKKVIDKKDLVVYAGINRVVNSTTPGQSRNIAQVVVHRKFKNGSNDYDIGLLILENAFQINSTVKPISIRRDPTMTREYCVLSGYGGVNDAEANSTKLVETTMSIYDFTKCKKDYKKSKFGTEMICANATDMKFCSDEYGMPLVCYGELAGIASHYDSKNCSKIGTPIAFTEVAAYREWIMRNKASSIEISFIGMLSISILAFLLK